MATNLRPNKSTVLASARMRALGKVLRAHPKQSVGGESYRDLLADLFQVSYSETDVKEFSHVPVERWINHALMEWMANDEIMSAQFKSSHGSLLKSLSQTAGMYDFLMENDVIRGLLEQQESVSKGKKDNDERKSKPYTNPLLQKQQEKQTGGDEGEEGDKEEQRDDGDKGDGDGESDGQQDKKGGQSQSRGKSGGKSDPTKGKDSSGNKEREQPRQSQPSQPSAEDRRAMENALARLEEFKRNILGKATPKALALESQKGSEAIDGMVKSWGIEEGNLTQLDIDRILQELQNRTGFIKAVSELAGRYMRMASSAFASVRSMYTGVVTEGTMTKDVTHLFPTELAYISKRSPKALRAIKTSQFVNGGLLGWKPISDATDGGSIFVMVDSSGSMGEDSQNLIAKAIAIGLTWAAKEDPSLNRQYSLAQFGTSGDGIMQVNSGQSWQDHWTWARAYYGGGTEFDYCIPEAISRMRKIISERGIRGMDLVFITDGGSALRESTMKQWLDFKAESGARLLYVDVSGSVNPQVMKIADLYLKETDLNSSGERVLKALASEIERNRLDSDSEQD